MTIEALPTDTAYRAVHFIETYTGRPFWPMNPRTQDVSIIDIAHHLSNECRFFGAASAFYSTAQHCCLLADFTEARISNAPADCLQILLHDASEAYLRDIARPIKQAMPEYRRWEHDVQMCIRQWAGLGELPVPSWQDEIDSRIIVDERAQVLSNSGLDWQHDLEPLGVVVEQWAPRIAEQQFLIRYAKYTRALFGSHQYLRYGWGIPTKCFDLLPFATASGDIPHGPVEPRMVADVLEVDIRGGVARVVRRSPNGMMIRDTKAGRFPAPAWEWMRGEFRLATPGIDEIEIGTVPTGDAA